MKINEILTESKNVREICDVIKRDCQPFLTSMGAAIISSPLYRGVISARPSFIKRICRKNRKPRDTEKTYSKVIDDWFLNKFGVRYRSNAIFATGNSYLASEFGNVYIIFPIGEFTFCWSPTVADMTYHLMGDDTELNVVDKDISPDDLIYHLNAANYSQHDIRRALKSGNEIMINCSGYYGISTEAFSANELKVILTILTSSAETTGIEEFKSQINARVEKIEFLTKKLETISECLNVYKSGLDEKDKVEKIKNIIDSTSVSYWEVSNFREALYYINAIKNAINTENAEITKLKKQVHAYEN